MSDAGWPMGEDSQRDYPQDPGVQSSGSARVKNDPEVVQDAYDKWQGAYEWVKESRTAELEDYKFVNGDSYNNFQWPGDVLDARGGPESDRPILTINKVRQNCLLITNDMKKNKPGVSFRPTGNGATVQSALMWNGLMRHIEAQSLAQHVYGAAGEFMVKMGYGAWRVKTDYVREDSFDQEIYIRPIRDPWSVLLDPDARLPDKSDAQFGFITEDVPRDQFEARYPQFADLSPNLVLDDSGQNWITKDHVRVAEFYRITPEYDTLYAYLPKGAAEPLMLFAGDLKGELKERVIADALRSRRVKRAVVKWNFIVGNQLVEQTQWLGKTIPIVLVAAEETIIEGRYDCKGHVRYLKDQQRMYNWFSSSGVEYGALQTKTPWLAPAEAIEEHEEDWNSSNVMNKSVLTYNSKNDAGEEIAAPQRIQPPISAPLCIEGMKIASGEIDMASGQYGVMFGAPGNERSGKAINERQQQGELSTYHFIDALAVGIRRTGEIVKEIATKVYDTRRWMQILQEDGKTLEVMLDPGAQKAYAEHLQEDQQTLLRIFNPNIGSYEVVADVGPDWITKREEAFNAFSMLLGQAPQLIPLLADLLLRSGDFPMAETAAERLYRMLPPQAKGEGPSPQEMQQQKQIQALSESLMQQLHETARLRLELKGKDQAKLIDAFKAVTERLKVVGEQQMNGAEIRALVGDTLRDALGIDMAAAANVSVEGLSNGEPTQVGPQDVPTATPAPMQMTLPGM